MSLVTQASTNTLTEPTGFFCSGDIYSSCFKDNLFKREGIFLFYFFFTNFASQCFGISTDPASLWGIKLLQESILTPGWLCCVLLRSFFSLRSVRDWRWTEPSWLGRVTQCRGPTSTASPCPHTPTSSRTCWEACRLQPCQDCPSVATAPPLQPR